MPPRPRYLHLWGPTLAPRTAPDTREAAPPFLVNHTCAYPVPIPVEEVTLLRVLFDVELDAIAVTGGNCRVRQLRHDHAGDN